jgi:para-aminobenzoate synthetase
VPALIIDNYDSFTFNLVHAVAAITGEMPLVVRNDELTWEQIRALDFDSVIISPGPGRPDRERDFGVSRDVILNATVPVLGVCLGHQGIACLFGGRVEQVPPVHGRTSEIIHAGDPLFRGIPERFLAVRYHSLAVLEPLPPELRKIAWSTDGTLMALRHTTRPIWGVQFHPESISSEYGIELLQNFLPSSPSSKAVKPASQPQAPGHGRFRKLPLRHAPEALFRELFSRELYAFWLDSSLVTERSRFSYMGASDEVHENAFDDIDLLLHGQSCAPDLPFPFNGGYVGYFGYECGSPHKHESPQPDSVLLRVENFLAIDHIGGALYLVGSESWREAMELRISTIIGTSAGNRRKLPQPVTCYSIARPEYLAKVRECLSLIEAGESYELCLTNKVRLKSEIPPLDYYETLRRTNPAPYSAFLQLDATCVASTSPECFLRIDRDRKAESRPIKGTVRRGQDAEEDATLRALLANDTRFRSENLMIVDLVRHDLSHVCEVGSVRVPRLMEVETYQTVHQLVSTIEGQLREDATSGDCLRALFPGGSMTGAPKRRSMELLDELEPDARGIYSGAIGYIGFNGTADLSIVIRTAVFDGENVTIGVGGAIVAQSDPDAEWEEMELKAQALLRAFESA